MIIILPSLSLQFLIRIAKTIGLRHDVIKSEQKKAAFRGLLHCVQRLGLAFVVLKPALQGAYIKILTR